MAFMYFITKDTNKLQAGHDRMGPFILSDKLEIV